MRMGRGGKDWRASPVSYRHNFLVFFFFFFGGGGGRGGGGG